jgi:hypothetical protein
VQTNPANTPSFRLAQGAPMRRTILIVVTITIVLLSSGFFYVKSMPHYSLYMLKRAIENHEPDEALKYINIDSIVDKLGRDFLGKDSGGNIQESGKNPSMKRMVTDALPGIKESIRSSFREAIASHGKGKQRTGADKAGASNEGTDNLNGSIKQEVPQENTSVRQLKSPGASVGGIEISNLDVRKIKEISLWDLDIRVDGKTAIVHVKNTPNIKAKMVKTDTGYWQFVEILLSP